MKVSVRQLRRLVKEATLSQARTEGPARELVTHLNGAKHALGELFQAATDQKASDQAQRLLQGITQMIKALNHMPELTQDPWHGARG